MLDADVVRAGRGTGVIGIEMRRGRRRKPCGRTALHDPPTALRLAAERAFAGHLHGSCHSPIAAYATLEGEALRLASAFVRSPDGREAYRDRIEGPAARAAARWDLHSRSGCSTPALLACSNGCATRAPKPRRGATELAGRTVIVTRPAQQSAGTVAALRALGAKVVGVSRDPHRAGSKRMLLALRSCPTISTGWSTPARTPWSRRPSVLRHRRGHESGHRPGDGAGTAARRHPRRSTTGQRGANSESLLALSSRRRRVCAC